LKKVKCTLEVEINVLYTIKVVLKYKIHAKIEDIKEISAKRAKEQDLTKKNNNYKHKNVTLQVATTKIKCGNTEYPVAIAKMEQNRYVWGLINEYWLTHRHAMITIVLMLTAALNPRAKIKIISNYSY
ncbi:24726_t:CDS:2, partial [Gigaspora rosea]